MMTKTTLNDGTPVFCLRKPEAKMLDHHVDGYLQNGISINDNDVVFDVGANVGVFGLRAIQKAKNFNFDLQGAVMASDAFFPFPDCVEIADTAGITAVIQPGGSIKDQLSIDYCDANNVSMVFTATRHFKH